MERDERIRIEIAFDGGQIVGAYVEPDVVEELERALDAPTRETLSLEADDGRYTIALKRVLYVRRFARDARVGFGA